MRGYCGIVIVALLSLAGCSNSTGVHVDLSTAFPEKLSAWRLFQGDQKELRPNEGVIPYDVNTPLFSNYAAKFRTVWMPKGVSGKYTSAGVLDLPVGTVLSKTFSFGDRHLETRLYIHKPGGWEGVTYVWNREQTEAILDVTPQPVSISWNGMDVDYDIPNVNQCKTCHEGANGNAPLGITARNLNRDYAYASGAENQLVHWAGAGYLRGLPPASELPTPGTSLDARAREYLDVNCGSCHVAGGRGAKSGVFLTAAESDLQKLGVCKPATAASASFDIQPGQPDRSMLLHRMKSLDRKIMMPDIGHSIVHREGVELIRDWITAMPGTCGSRAD